MTAQARRAARSINPKTRDMAEALARQSGVSLSDWAAALAGADDLQEVVLTDDGQPPAADTPGAAPTGRASEETARLSRALEILSERLDAAETRSALAVSNVDKTLRETLDRLRGGEREQTAVAARFEGAVQDLTAENARLSDRMARIEAEARGPRSAEALRSLEAALGTVAEHLYQGESRTEEALAALRVRVERIEAEPSDPTLMNEAALAILGVKGRLETLAGQIASQGEAIQTIEQRSLHAIERMGAEVVEVSQSLIRRVQSAEARGAEAIEQVGGEVSRIAASMEAKLGRADAIQAQALDRLGAEVERISDKLAERIANSDRRAAQAIDEVGDQVALITERLGQRHERATDDLGDRIRQSEERTAALLKEARTTIAKLSAGSPFAETPVPPILDPETQAPAETAAGQALDGAIERASASEPEAEPDTSDPAFADRTIAFEPLAEEREAPEAEPTAVAEPTPDDQATRSAQPARTFTTLYGSRELTEEPKPRSFTGSEGPIFTGLTFQGGKRRRSGRTAAVGFGMAAAFGLALGGFFVAENEPRGGVVTKIAYLLSRSPKGEGQLREGRAGVRGDVPRAAMALTPTPLGGAGSANGEVAALYTAAVDQVEANDTRGVPQLRRAADLGYAPAQFYLAKLYENGADGIAKDPGEARLWTQKAAMGGDARAMHNLALYEFEGAGGPKNIAAAADWFRRAANLGLIDSQYNLGRLYEQGYGVAQNTAEAYKWYLIASASGDAQSKAAAARVRSDLSPDARAVAERAAAEFRPSSPQPTPASAPATGADANVVTAQRGLSALGYYQGPTDGAATPALKLALASYQRDQGLPVTGALDPTTVGRLQALNQ